MQTITLKIEGMTCNGCVLNIEKILNAIEGVQATEVSLEKAQAQITFNANQVQVSHLIEVIEDAGFDAQI